MPAIFNRSNTQPAFPNKRRKNSRRGIQGSIICLALVVATMLLAWAALTTYKASTRGLNDLTHITGKIAGERYIKHWVKGSKFSRGYYEPVLILSIEGCRENFGFIENYKDFSRLASVRFADNSKIAEIYYDESGDRIEENVTLHVYDLKIGNEVFVKIKDVQKRDLIVSLVLSVVAVLLGWLTILAIGRQIREN